MTIAKSWEISLKVINVYVNKITKVARKLKVDQADYEEINKIAKREGTFHKPCICMTSKKTMNLSRNKSSNKVVEGKSGKKAFSAAPPPAVRTPSRHIT